MFSSAFQIPKENIFSWAFNLGLMYFRMSLTPNKINWVSPVNYPINSGNSLCLFYLIEIFKFIFKFFKIPLNLDLPEGTYKTDFSTSKDGKNLESWVQLNILLRDVEIQAMALVDEIRKAQRARGPAMVLAIGTAVPVTCFYQADYPDYFFRVTKTENLTELKAKFKRVFVCVCVYLRAFFCIWH